MIGGNAALDFVNTAAYWSSGDPEDRLGGPKGFGEWAMAAGLLYGDDMARLEKEIAADKQAGNDVFETAIALRAALYRIFHAVITESDVDDADLAVLRIRNGDSLHLVDLVNSVEVLPQSRSHGGHGSGSQGARLLADIGFDHPDVEGIGEDLKPQAAFTAPAHRHHLVPHAAQPSQFIKYVSKAEGNPLQCCPDDVRLGMAQVQPHQGAADVRTGIQR